MHKIETRELHLAAYMKASGASFQGHEGGNFVFLSEKSLSEWRVAHSNSCCRRVDLELISLRKFLPKRLKEKNG